VSVEQLNHRPANLSDIRRLARRLLEGRIVAAPPPAVVRRARPPRVSSRPPTATA